MQAVREAPLLIHVLKTHTNNVPVMRAATLCLPRLTAVLSTDSSALFLSLGEICLSIFAETHDTKIVRSTTKSIVVMLRRDLQSETKTELCDRMVQMCVRAFEAPVKTAAMASKETDAKSRSRLQDALDKDVLSMMRILVALPDVLPWTSLDCMAVIIQELQKLFSLQLPEVSVRVCDIFTAVFPVVASLDVKLSMEMVKTLKHVVDTTQMSSAGLFVAFGTALHAGLSSLRNRHLAEFLELFAAVAPTLISMVHVLVTWEYQMSCHSWFQSLMN